MDLSRERRREIDRLFADALDAAPEERLDLVRKRAGDDRALADTVIALLAGAHHDDDFLTPGAVLGGPIGKLFTNLFDISHPVPRELGAYRIIGELGRGGSSIVHRAERSQGGFEQRVAIKLIRPGASNPNHMRRFEQERQILASLNHPNIACLFDGGETPEGQPWFTMELVDGLPIDRYCDENALSIADRLELMVETASAVAYAHELGIVHRDLKPSNILVNERGHVKLLDFGIAKILAPDLVTGETPLTRTAMMPLTPEFATPEQVRGEPVTPASDVYQLGLILYRMLTGQLPYAPVGRTPDRLAEAVCERSVRRPSRVVASSASPYSKLESRSANPHWEQVLRGDLDNIVLMALRKEPERRYPSAREFADDIRRYRDGEPVLARAESYVYRLGKRVQRNAFALVSTGVSISVALAWLLTVQFGEQGATPASNTLAVIPFTGLDGASRNDLGDAMAEESIRSLAAQPRLYVLASQVSFPVAENGLSLRALSRRLEVRSILHGRAGLRGGHLEVTAELVDAVSGKLLWTETYRREPMKLSAVQDLVTTQVIAALQREFDLALERPQQVPVPANFETYENYLLGQHYLWQRTPESIGKAIGVLNQAVELDPDYAAAWSLLAAVYNAGVAHLGNRASMLDHAEAAALRALELDPSLGLPHTVLGSVYYNRGDLGTGFRHMQTAMSLDPEDPTTLTWYAEALATLGHLQEALASARAAYARAPVSPVSDARLGWAHLLNGNYQRGAEFCGRAWGAGLRGTNAVWLCLVVASLESGDRSGLEGWWNAVEWGELAGRAERAYLAARHSPDPNTREAAVRQVIAAVEAGQLQVEYMESAYAVYLAGTLGALDWVYRYLHDRLDRHEVVNETIWWLPAMRALRADPRFSDLARRKGLFGAWEVLGWPDQCDLEGETLACR